ncbi:MAG: winged helix-turn-helix domain-containing protein [Anaerolineae bacterium]
MDVREVTPSSLLGLNALAALRAEEEPWLARCFVPPDEFALMGGLRSVAVFGKSGSGKSAVCQMLLKEAGVFSSEPRFLVVRWQPMPSALEALTGFQSVPGQVAHLFDSCAYTLLEHLVTEPPRWREAPHWACRFLVWFIRSFLQGDRESRVGPLEEQAGREGTLVLKDLLDGEEIPPLIATDQWPLIGRELSKTVQRLGWEGIWIVIDGIEPWVEAQPQRAGAALGALLASLPLFQETSLAYKAFLPSRLQPILASAAGLERGRLQPFRLNWREDQLILMTEKRLSLAFGRPMTLRHLCGTPGLLEWLRRAGGDSPRAWLEAVRPLVAHALACHPDKPVPEETWKTLRRQNPPRLELDAETGAIRVGGREIPVGSLPPGGLRLLHYLYRNAGRRISWEELYYLGYRGRASVPRTSDDSGYEERKTWESVLFTRLSELRKAIEPDPEDPLYIETLRGEGIIFHLYW